MHRLRRGSRLPALRAEPAGRGFGTASHLAARFFRSVLPRGPGVAGDAWARRWLTQAEQELWERMPGADRRHATASGRKVAAALGNADGTGVPRAVIAAALLHDVGKADARLGLIGRVAATVTALCVGRERAVAWSDRRSGWRRRVGRYAAHDGIGARLLEAAGSDASVVAWAREHHLPPARWSVGAELGQVLSDADSA